MQWYRSSANVSPPPGGRQPPRAWRCWMLRGKTPCGCHCLSRSPHTRKGPITTAGIPLQMASSGAACPCSASPDSPSVPELEGAVPSQDLALVPSRWPSPPPGFLPKPLEDPPVLPMEDTHLAQSHNLI